MNNLETVENLKKDLALYGANKYKNYGKITQLYNAVNDLTYYCKTLGEQRQEIKDIVDKLDTELLAQNMKSILSNRNMVSFSMDVMESEFNSLYQPTDADDSFTKVFKEKDFTENTLSRIIMYILVYRYWQNLNGTKPEGTVYNILYKYLDIDKPNVMGM